MDLTQVIPVLLSGIAQEVGVEPTELKLVLVGDEHQFDTKLLSGSLLIAILSRTQNRVWKSG